MPTYEYECTACGHEFEKFHAMSAPTPACPKCKGAVAKKITASGGVIVKGANSSCGGNLAACESPCAHAQSCAMGHCAH